MNICWTHTGLPLTVSELNALGVLSDRISPAEKDLKLSAWKMLKGLGIEREVTIDPKLKNFRAILQFAGLEHRHLTDEAWLVCEGNASIEIEVKNNLSIRIDLEPSDFAYIPAHRWHRLICFPDQTFRFIRLVSDYAGLKPLYRKNNALAAV